MTRLRTATLRLLRKYPFLRGRSRIARMLLRSPQEIPAGEVVTARSGLRFRVHADPMYVGVYLFGEYEPLQTEIYSALIRRGDTVVDVGTNFGWYAATFGRRVGATGQVHAFEPVPALADLADETLALNELRETVTLNRLALGSTAGELVVHTFSGLPHGHASVARLGRSDAMPHSCPASTLDSYLADRQVSTIDFLKLDVEGYEYDVLRGSTGLLSRLDAPVVSFEINQQCMSSLGVAPQELEEILRDSGYTRLWRLHARGTVERVARVLSDNADYIACKDSRLERVRQVLPL